jgi:hypothetical protein
MIFDDGIISTRTLTLYAVVKGRIKDKLGLILTLLGIVMGRKRFSRYEYGLKKLMRTGSATTAQPPAGSALAEYARYKAGEKVITGNKVTNRQGKVQVAIKPFGVNPANTTFTIVEISGRAEAAKETLVVNPGIFGHSVPGEDDREQNGFVPAAAIILKARGSGTPTPSKITGIPYKKKTTSGSYTIPFGQSGAAGSNYYLSAQTAIILAVQGKDKGDSTSTYSVSFRPERLYRS